MSWLGILAGVDFEAPRDLPSCLYIFLKSSGINRYPGSRIPMSSDSEREMAYIRSRVYLKAEMEKLINNHGWVLKTNGAEDWFHVSKATFNQRTSSPSLRVPLEFSSLLPNHLKSALHLFHPVVERISSDKIKLYVTEDPPPLATIFYILQVVAPGFVAIVYNHPYDHLGEMNWSYVLPQPSWLEEHRDMLVDILGSHRKYQLILEFSKNQPIYQYEFYAHQEMKVEDVWAIRPQGGGSPRFPSDLLIGSPQTS
ncbi:hypothetical protein M413DRAFT_29893 [Hebeloma cylindrosporum]|uniref:Uncharacterized protein n=1 Tax=Hebeloma cylindrosporum TaxID=76867 RepID=A0A0C2XLP6_HEBCY|nr:hypothetical protein M413DRAFT_29893 [Hebeloma cylindrosporum h7]